MIKLDYVVGCQSRIFQQVCCNIWQKMALLVQILCGEFFCQNSFTALVAGPLKKIYFFLRLPLQFGPFTL